MQEKDNGSSVQIENSVTQVTVQHHSANSYPRDGIDSYILTWSHISEDLIITGNTETEMTE